MRTCCDLLTLKVVLWSLERPRGELTFCSSSEGGGSLRASAQMARWRGDNHRRDMEGRLQAFPP